MNSMAYTGWAVASGLGIGLVLGLLIVWAFLKLLDRTLVPHDSDE